MRTTAGKRSVDPNAAHARARRAIGAIIARPNVKLPWRLAHSIISGKARQGGAARVSTARINVAIQATITGSARM
jgi:hypothetical protein